MHAHKYIFEEMGLAAFLLEIFERTPPATQRFRYKFADLGCGNGLLTYFLCAEGHSGVGVDIRRRKLWDAYDPQPELREETVQPHLGQSYE